MPTRTDRTIEFDIRSEARHFYSVLEARVKSYQPSHFIPTMVRAMRHYIKAGQYQFAPQFRIALAIEANCAYHRGHATDVLTHNRFARIMNTFHHEEPGLTDLIQKDWGFFFLILYREQIELQRSFCELDISRYRRMFIHDDPLPKLAARLRKQYGITPEQWIKASFAFFAAAENNPSGCITLALTPEYERIGVTPDDLHVYLHQSASTPKEIGERFKKLREQTQPKFYPCIRSVFLERPIIDFGDGQYLSPFPAIAFHHAGMGLYRLLFSLPEFSIEFGPALERHVEHILGSMPNVHQILPEQELKKYIKGKTCDCIIQLDDYVLLVECKATTFSRDVITPETIPNDNSTRKVTQALVQLSQSAQRIKMGELRHLGIAEDARLESIVVTFGDIPFVNAPWYFDRFFAPHVERELNMPLESILPNKPIVVALHDLEFLVVAMHYRAMGLPDLRRQKEELGFAAAGDWDTYIQSCARGGSVEAALPYVAQDVADFYSSMGLSDPDLERRAIDGRVT